MPDSSALSKRLKTLPLWAQQHIARLEARVESVEKTLPWTEPGMQWFTLFHPATVPNTKPAEHGFRLFTCSDTGTHCVCTIGPTDFVFVGRGKPTVEKF